VRDYRSPIETAAANTILKSFAYMVFFIFKKTPSKLHFFENEKSSGL
jgi:hypothetical protein